ncbi:uncharacterized protein MONBRDRAFT_12123 [Monosiga brevicollis MX1]|uniref:Uncharacterized protein n=1 Tax=Monosiga brevicollis TaxID=81824 RepID=A9VBA4_MONBE|nr:uncharacterized protein MONBRDRAFT_12123 [Monosiga brevicollis MX1]EDQ85203.1 predicted protein [Monosiga brevicollis MX1]|eukprot:XP_001750028.1 hypothetical protein [Monosiga brevicollis MX1]
MGRKEKRAAAAAAGSTSSGPTISSSYVFVPSFKWQMSCFLVCPRSTPPVLYLLMRRQPHKRRGLFTLRRAPRMAGTSREQQQHQHQVQHHEQPSQLPPQVRQLSKATRKGTSNKGSSRHIHFADDVDIQDQAMADGFLPSLSNNSDDLGLGDWAAAAFEWDTTDVTLSTSRGLHWLQKLGVVSRHFRPEDLDSTQRRVIDDIMSKLHQNNIDESDIERHGEERRPSGRLDMAAAAAVAASSPVHTTSPLRVGTSMSGLPSSQTGSFRAATLSTFQIEKQAYEDTIPITEGRARTRIEPSQVAAVTHRLARAWAVGATPLQINELLDREIQQLLLMSRARLQAEIVSLRHENRSMRHARTGQTELGRALAAEKSLTAKLQSICDERDQQVEALTRELRRANDELSVLRAAAPARQSTKAQEKTSEPEGAKEALGEGQSASEAEQNQRVLESSLEDDLVSPTSPTSGPRFSFSAHGSDAAKAALLTTEPFGLRRASVRSAFSEQMFSMGSQTSLLQQKQSMLLSDRTPDRVSATSSFRSSHAAMNDSSRLDEVLHEHGVPKSYRGNILSHVRRSGRRKSPLTTPSSLATDGVLV